MRTNPTQRVHLHISLLNKSFTTYTAQLAYATVNIKQHTPSQQCTHSYRHIFSLVYTPHVPAKGLHPFEGLSTVITYKVFPFGVYSLVSVQCACGNKRFSTYITSVGSLPGVRPDVRREVGAIAETFFAHGATIRPVFVFLAVVLVGVKRQHGVLQVTFEAGRGRDEILDVRVQPVQLLLVVAHPELSVRLLLLLLDLRGLRVLLLHAAALVRLAVRRLGGFHCGDGGD